MSEALELQAFLRRAYAHNIRVDISYDDEEPASPTCKCIRVEFSHGNFHRVTYLQPRHLAVAGMLLRTQLEMFIEECAQRWAELVEKED